MKGMHGKMRQQGVLAHPDCTDCHSAHAIQQHEAPKFQTEVIKECGTCHAEYAVVVPRHLPWPGDGARLLADGNLRVVPRRARGAARIESRVEGVEAEPARDVPAMPRRRVGPNFASFDPHANRHDKTRNPLYYWAAKFMELLLFGVFAFFGIHTVFWLYREVREKLKSGKERH